MKRLGIQFLLIGMSMIFLAFSGCGKKAAPLPPQIKGQKIAAPFDLTYAVAQKKVSLAWRHETDPENALVLPEGFEIFSVKKTFDACAGCPFEFKSIGMVMMPAMEFTTFIEKGFNYYFRVQATGENDMKSEFSRTIQFEYK